MIDELQVKVICFRDDFSDLCTVKIRTAMTPRGKIAEPVCPFYNPGFSACQDCRVRLQQIFMDENYRHDPKTVLNPITGDRYPIPQDRRKRR